MRKFLLFLGDVTILYTSLIITLILRYRGGWELHLNIHLFPFTMLFLVWLLIFYISNLYEKRVARNNAPFYSSLLTAIAIAGSLSIIFFYIIPFIGITPKTNFIIFLVVSTGLLTVWRRFHNNLLAKTALHRNTVFIGLNEQTMEVSKFLLSNLQFGFKPLYILDTQTNSAFSFNEVDFRKVDTSDDIQKLLEKENIKVIVLSPQAYRLPHIVDVLYKNVGKDIEFFNLSNFYENITGKVPLEAINQTWFLDNIKSHKKLYEISKRLIDLAGGILLGLPAFFVTPLIAFAIKFDSAGPIFYKQKRTGRGGKVFEMLKFRTMRENAELQKGKLIATWAQENDPRITRLGRLLRKTRLDELPQIWNILKGEMSFVGPRSERPEFHDKLTKEVPFYEARYIIKPGATGWAQVQYRYGASVADTKEKLQYDLFYIKNRSIVLDLAILLKTFNIVLRGGGR